MEFFSTNVEIRSRHYMFNWLHNRSFFEHEGFPDGVSVEGYSVLKSIHFKNDPNSICVELLNQEKIKLSYYVGVDWLNYEQRLAIHVEPKLNKEARQTD